MKTLIIEFQTSGHYPEYLKHVLKKINKDHKSEDFIIFLTPLLIPHLKNLKNTEIYKSIHFFEESLGKTYSHFKSTKHMADFIYQQIIKVNKQFQFDHVLFLNLNLILRHYSILNPFLKLPFTFSGIIFNSPYRFREQNTKRLTIFKRELYLRLLLFSKNCTRVFLLNDRKGVNFYREWSSKIEFINDPVRITSPSKLDIYNYHTIKPSALTFLQIGKLDAYKGTLDIIDAFSNLDAAYAEKVHLLLIGKVNRDTDLTTAKVHQLKEQNRISIRNDFVPDDDFSAYMQQSDVVLITNKNVENSSGIVNHCLANNKVVIAPDKGFYKEAFKGYKGIVNYNDSFSLKHAIIHAINTIDKLKIEAQHFDSKAFIKANSAHKFSETLLKHLN